MGVRVRKSWSLGPLRINLSKSGIGYSVGTKGFRVTKKANGGYRTTASIPGTGLAYIKDYSGNEKQGGENMKQQNLKERKPKKPFPWRWVIFVFFVIGTIMFLPTLGSIFMAFAAVLSFPKGPIAEFWRKTNGFRVAQILVLVLLMSWSTTFAKGAPLLQTDGGVEGSSFASSSDLSSVNEENSSSSVPEQEDPLPSSSANSTTSSVEQSSQASQSDPIVTSPSVTEPVTPPVTQEPSSESPVADVEDETVWVARSGGNKYHINPECSGMKNPISMTKTEAINLGKEPCDNCCGK